MRHTIRWRAVALVAVLALLAGTAVACGDDAGPEQAGAATESTADTPATSAPEGATVFTPSATAIDPEAGTATLPLFEDLGPEGSPVFYVVTESSDAADAEARGVPSAPKLANALGTAAVQEGTPEGDAIAFAGTVDFAPERSVTPGPEGFPPDDVAPGAVGDDAYSPLVSTDGAIVLNATHVMNDTGTHDSVLDIDTAAGTVTLKTLRGFFEGQEVVYLRLDASSPVVAALEESILAPNLDAAPGLGSVGDESARSTIVPVVNGVREADDPERQGLQSAVLGEGEPLNVTASIPGGPDYSPAWEVVPVVWGEAAVEAGARVRLTATSDIAARAEAGELVSGGEGPAHAELGGLLSAGFISNCPTLALLA